MDDAKELTEYIDTVLRAIDEGMKNNNNFYIAPQDKITIELAIINSKKAEGGVKIFVLNAGGKYNKDEISKITIPISRKRTGGFRVASN